MKYQKILFIVLATALLAACSSHKMGKMSADGILPQAAAAIASVGAI